MNNFFLMNNLILMIGAVSTGVLWVIIVFILLIFLFGQISNLRNRFRVFDLLRLVLLTIGVTGTSGLYFWFLNTTILLLRS